MGRALLIICSGVFVALGFVSIGINQQAETITQSNISYAESFQANNTAYTATQIALNKLTADTMFAYEHDKSNPWQTVIRNDTAEVYFEKESGHYGTRDTTVVRVYATAGTGAHQGRVVSLYRRYYFDFVPKFRSALSFATPNFNFSMGGSSQITGNSSNNRCEDMPGITTIDDDSRRR
ncbi:MAG: hypothetical protein R3281_10165, partial [Balneolaceae bacterium]|nr:hypothetical protein [Balneolaceae bacterium]